MGRDGGDLRLRELERRLAALDFIHGAEKAAVPALGDERLEREPVHRLAGNRRRDQRQLHDRAPNIGRGGGRQRDHVHDQRGAIVGASRVERGRHQRACSVVRRRALAQSFGDGVVGQDPVHAVATQQETVVQSHRLGAIVEARVRFGAERAREHARVARSAFPGVILGETGQAVAPEPIGARVADVQQVGDAGAQHERGEGAGHPLEARDPGDRAR